jgi:hypothetical protein
MSNEYIGSVAIVAVSILKLFGIEVANDAVSGLVVGVVALWVAFRRYQRGDITPLGVRKLEV